MNLIDAAVTRPAAHRRSASKTAWRSRCRRPRPRGWRAPGVVLGVKPEDVVPGGHGVQIDTETFAFRQAVDFAEPLGTDSDLFIQFGGREIVSKMFIPGRWRRRGHPVPAEPFPASLFRRQKPARQSERRHGENRPHRTVDGGPDTEGRAHRRDPELRQPGNADRAHHRRRRRPGNGYSYTIDGGSSVMACWPITWPPP